MTTASLHHHPEGCAGSFGREGRDVLTISEDSGKLELVPERSDVHERLTAARRGMETYKIALRELAE